MNFKITLFWIQMLHKFFWRWMLFLTILKIIIKFEFLINKKHFINKKIKRFESWCWFWSWICWSYGNQESFEDCSRQRLSVIIFWISIAPHYNSTIYIYAHDLWISLFILKIMICRRLCKKSNNFFMRFSFLVNCWK